MKTKIVIILGLVLLLANTVMADEITVDTLDYKENKWVVIDGNVTLTFISSDTGTEDISLLFRLYDQENNKTIYNVVSNEIVTYIGFVNDTKKYTYGCCNNSYIILVDYSSISLPPSFEEIIAEYEVRIENLTMNNTLLLEELINVREALNANLEENLALSLELTEEQALNRPLKDQIEELENEISNLEFNLNETMTTSKSDVAFYSQRYDEYRNPWTLTTSDGLYINLASLIMGIFLILIIIYVIYMRKLPGSSKLVKIFGKEKVEKEPDELGSEDLEALKGVK